jgi:hypothetical protein
MIRHCADSASDSALVEHRSGRTMKLPSYRTIAVAAGTAVAVVGIGTAALATSGTATTSGSGHPAANAAHRHRHALRGMLEHVLHAQVTTRGKSGYVTHSAVRGAVTKISPTAVTVRSADGFTETFTVTSATRVREHVAGQHHASKGALSDVKSGDQVAVLGKAAEGSSGDPDATVIVDGLRK